MSDQIKYSFDTTTIRKILKGMLYAVALPAVIAALEYLGTADFGNSTMTMVLSWIVPVLVNAIREFMKGQ